MQLKSIILQFKEKKHFYDATSNCLFIVATSKWLFMTQQHSKNNKIPESFAVLIALAIMFEMAKNTVTEIPLQASWFS